MKATFKSHLAKFDSQLWKYHLIVPTKIATKLIANKHKRIICQINDNYKWQTALMKSADYWFILLNQKRIDEGGFSLNNSLKITIEPDLSTYGMDIPEEFAELLFQDEEANNYFNALTSGKQRNLIYIINKVKSSDSRLKKALAISHHLKEMQGRIDFKILNNTINEFNKHPI